MAWALQKMAYQRYDNDINWERVLTFIGEPMAHNSMSNYNQY